MASMASGVQYALRQRGVGVSEVALGWKISLGEGHDDADLTMALGLGSIREIELYSVKFSGAGWKMLGHVSPERVVIGGCVTWSPAAIVDLIRRPGLKRLSLNKCPIADEVIEEGLRMGGFVDLQSLNLQGSKLTDNGFALLSALDSLRDIDLGYTQVRNGSTSLVNLRHVVDLSLEGTKCNSSLLRNLSKWDLQVLILSLCEYVTDADCEIIEQIPSLCTVGVNKTGISDCGLSRILMLPRLERVFCSVHAFGVNARSAWYRSGRNVELIVNGDGVKMAEAAGRGMLDSFEGVNVRFVGFR